jgi:hypothetical protein
MILFDLLVEFTDIIMMRKCMLGIKRRAERASRQAPELSGATGHRQLRPDEPGIQDTQVEIRATP